MNEIRCFFCINLSEQMAGRIGLWIEQARRLYRNFRWVQIRNEHITLRFCGEVPEEQVRKVTALFAARLDAARRCPFEILLSAPGTFGRPPRVLWAGIQSSPALNELQCLVEDSCVEAGMQAETCRFLPHLTLARINVVPRPDWFEKLPSWTLGGEISAVSECLLMRSTLTPNGPHYSVIERFPMCCGKAALPST